MLSRASLLNPLLLVTLGCLTIPARGHEIRIETLTATISPTSVGPLDGLWCRNVDKIIRLQLAIEWPGDKSDQEITGDKRLVFWSGSAEHLFPFGSYSFQHGDWIIDGYFIARSGGMQQGIVSEYFEPIDDTKVLLNPDVRQVEVKNSDCK